MQSLRCAPGDLAIYLAAHRSQPRLDLQDVAGFLILACSVAGEAIADTQMRRFKADHRSQGRICDAGLWGWSRHPNYFFEWLGWVAYPVIALSVTEPWSLLSIAAPALMYVILTRLTGVVLLEAAMVRSKGEIYRDYQRRVPAFFPRPPERATRDDGGVT